MEFLAGGYLLVALLLLVLAIAWIILPFALLGTKPLLRQLIAESRRTNELLAELSRPRQSPPPVPAAPPSNAPIVTAGTPSDRPAS